MSASPEAFEVREEPPAGPGGDVRIVRVAGDVDLSNAEELLDAVRGDHGGRREHGAAVELQRSLLPQSLPQLEGVEFAARYEPAGQGLQVGGDWYVVPGRRG